MFRDKNLFHPGHAPLFAVLWCFLATVPMRAEDSTTPPASAATPAAASSDAPGFSNHAPVGGLRPPESPDPSGPDLANTTVPGAPEGAATSSAPATPSQNVTINLINLMVKRGLITKEDAGGLIKQAEDEAVAARQQAAAAGQAENNASPGQPTETTPTPAVPVDDDTVRVTYVPEVVKQELRTEIKQDVMEETREANGGAASQIPDWVHRFHITGDIRVREEGDFYPSGNDNTGGFPNFNAINTSSGFDVNPNNAAKATIPYYDVDQDRERLRLRARIGAGIDLGDGFTAGMRIATGQDNSPVTQNQTLGLANNGQGGNFSKYAIWLDRAFIEYELWGQPEKDLTFTVGRFDNPFFSTSMIWASDIGFDGAVIKAKYEVTPGVTPFVTAGFFPVFNTDYNFSSDQSAKSSSEDKYLFAGQTGVKWKIDDDFSFLGAVALYDFDNIEGKLSDPIEPSSNEAGNTDDSRPSFAQNGNSYMALRDYLPLASPTDTTPENQYYGLATGFRELALTSQLDFGRFDPFHMSLVGEYVKNLAFDRNQLDSAAVNNRGDGGLGSYDGGDSGYYIGAQFGKVALEKLWDWNVGMNYRYVESDAVVDGFTDSDFGADLAGTNLKGYTLEGNLSLTSRVWLHLRFMSADAIAGPPFENDLVQFDINAKF